MECKRRVPARYLCLRLPVGLHSSDAHAFSAVPRPEQGRQEYSNAVWAEQRAGLRCIRPVHASGLPQNNVWKHEGPLSYGAVSNVWQRCHSWTWYCEVSFA